MLILVEIYEIDRKILRIVSVISNKEGRAYKLHFFEFAKRID